MLLLGFPLKLLFPILDVFACDTVIGVARAPRGTSATRTAHGNGDEEIRTLDPLLARQVLSQLSYVPGSWRPPALPHRLQCSTIGRSGLNHRVRDGNGCDP